MKSLELIVRCYKEYHRKIIKHYSVLICIDGIEVKYFPDISHTAELKARHWLVATKRIPNLSSLHLSLDEYCKQNNILYSTTLTYVRSIDQL